MIDVNITGGEMPQEEVNEYIMHAADKYPNKRVVRIDIHIDGEYVDLKYYFEQRPFERIRRITGYLVGTLDRFNDAKRAEVNERVKHDI